ncbi:MAG: molybdopterin-binding protein, partial [Planctomycetota bacterium]
NSNLYSLSARIGEWGALSLPRPTLRDTPEETRAGLRQTLALRPDAIVTTGGISAGDLDFVREVARELGDDTRVRRVSMKPGKPLVDGTIAGVPFFGLPGNPAACLVSFEMFVRPALARMEGRGDGLLPRRRARIREGRRFPHGGRLQLLRGIVRHDADTAEYTLEPLRSQGSHLLSSFAGANCLVEIPAHVSELRAGEMVSVLLL